MRTEVVGYSPVDVVKSIKENAPPDSIIPDAEWNAWAGEAAHHEYLHTQPSRNHRETLNVVWEYGVITSTLAIKIPELINETYTTIRWLYFEVATAAFVQPQGGFDQLPPKVIEETAAIVGDEMSDPDWSTWKAAHDQTIREDWEQSITDKITSQEESQAEQSESEQPGQQQ